MQDIVFPQTTCTLKASIGIGIRICLFVVEKNGEMTFKNTLELIFFPDSFICRDKHLFYSDVQRMKTLLKWVNSDHQTTLVSF